MERRTGSAVRTLLRDPVEEVPYLGLAVTTVATQRADGRQLAGLGPTGHRLGVDTEQRGDLGRGEQSLGLCGVWVHGVPPGGIWHGTDGIGTRFLRVQRCAEVGL